MTPLILIGASVRAAAQSARRAGFEPYCVDQFADEDLKACAHILQCNDFPNGLEATLNAAPDACWLYTGGLENHPALVDRLSKVRPLLGNRGAALRLVRNPRWLQDTLRQYGLPAIDVQLFENANSEVSTASHARHVERDRSLNRTEQRRWLHKPLHSAGGRGISIAADDAQDSSKSNIVTPNDDQHYVQEFVEGISISALFVAARCSSCDTAMIELCGVTRQLIGDPSTNAPPFGYSGSIAPLNEVDLPTSVFRQIEEIGIVIAREASLCGLFGIDFVVDAKTGSPNLIEVNPRYTASAELIELATSQLLIRKHWLATMPTSQTQCCSCERRDGENGFAQPTLLKTTLINGNASIGSALRINESHVDSPNKRCGKLVMYAARSIQAPNLIDAAMLNTDFRIADIPRPGSDILAGAPICSILSNGDSVNDCLERLHAAAEQFKNRWCEFRFENQPLRMHQIEGQLTAPIPGQFVQPAR